MYSREGAWGASGRPTEFLVDVTSEHIERGRRGVFGECPIALAMRDAKRHGDKPEDPKPIRHANVSAFISWKHNGRLIGVATPPKTLDWLHDFDDGRAVKPFSFSLFCYGVSETE